MSVKLKLNNFQIIKEAELEFDKGINLIVGSNSSGKSAILRAFQAVLLNPSSAKRYIKHGETSTSVKLEIQDTNQEIEWTRKESGVKYIINGEENTKCGRNTLFDFTELPFIYDSAENKILNVQTEHDPLFPFNRSNVELFKLFEDIFQMTDTALILNAIKKDEQDTTKILSELKIKDVELDTKLNAINEFNVLHNVDDIDKSKVHLEYILNELKDLENSLIQAEILDENIKHLNNSFPKPIDKKLQDSFLNLNSDFEVYSDYETYMRIFNSIPNIKISKLDFDLSVVTEYLELLKDYDKCESLNKNLDLDFTISQDFNLEVLLEYIELSNLECDNLVSDLKSIVQEISILEKTKLEVENELNEVKVCPLCNNPVH